MNINDFCWVRLTDAALTVAKDEIKMYGRPNGQWTRFQVWHLMSIFGPHMEVSCPQYFVSNEIVFEEPKQSNENLLELNWKYGVLGE